MEMVGGVPGEYLAGVLDRVLRRPLTNPLDNLQKVISVASAEAFTPRLVRS